MEIPQYDPKRPIIEFDFKVQEYLSFINKDKYDIVLKFINKYFEKSKLTFKSLLSVKNIPEYYLTDIDNNTEILNLYGSNTLKLLNIEFDLNDINDSTTIKFLSTILKTINYKLVKKKIKSTDSKNNTITKIFYSVNKI